MAHRRGRHRGQTGHGAVANDLEWAGQTLELLDVEATMFAALADDLEAGRLAEGSAMACSTVEMLRGIASVYKQLVEAGRFGVTLRPGAIATMRRAAETAEAARQRELGGQS